MENATGSVVITASAPGFTDGSDTVDVVQSGLDIGNLASAIGATEHNDPFQVRVGIPNTYGTALAQVQNVRAGVGSLLVTVTKSNALVAQLLTLSEGANSMGCSDS